MHVTKFLRNFPLNFVQYSPNGNFPIFRHTLNYVDYHQSKFHVMVLSLAILKRVVNAGYTQN